MAEPPLADYEELRARFGLLRGDASGCAPSEQHGVFGCACADCARWHAFVAGKLPAEGGDHPRYEVFTAPHVAALAALLLNRRAAYAAGRALRVLEVGAGDGRLAHHLGAALRLLDGGYAVELTASDSDERGLRAASPCGSLVRVAPCDASLLEATQPDVVIACWQPLGVDWTTLFRATPCIREYVLIGEADDGICGRPWETWGCRTRDDSSGESSGDESEGGPRRASADDEGRAALRRRAVAPYVADGFVRADLPELSRWQLCRTDERWRSRGASRTVSFTRRGQTSERERGTTA